MPVFEQVRRWRSPAGDSIELSDARWTQNGDLTVQVACHDLQGLLVGGGNIRLSSPADRANLTKEIAQKSDGDGYHAVLQVWAANLLACWERLSEEKKLEVPQGQWEHLSDHPMPDPAREFWEGLMAKGMIATIYGDSGQGKSTIVNGLAVSAAAEVPFLGRKVIPGPVMLLDYELTRDWQLRRLYPIAHGLFLDRVPKGIWYREMDVRQTLDDFIPEFMEQFEKVQPVLVIVDSMGPASGGETMDNKAIIGLMGGALKRLDTTLLLVDHQAKPQMGRKYSALTAYGSGYKTNLTRSALQVEMRANVTGKASIQVRHQKYNFGPKSKDLFVHLRYEAGKIHFEMGKETDSEFSALGAKTVVSKIIDALRKATHGLSYVELAEATGASEGSIRNAMKDAMKEAEIVATQGGGSTHKRFILVATSGFDDEE